MLQPLEDAIRTRLIPALTEGRIITDDERLLLSLPPRLGGMGIVIPPKMSDQEYAFSKSATIMLTRAIVEQRKELPPDLENLSKEAKSKTITTRREQQSALLGDLRSHMSNMQNRANEICCEAGASNWLTALPLEDKGFSLTKREFWDAVNLRYSWPISRLPSKCACAEVCHDVSIEPMLNELSGETLTH